MYIQRGGGLRFFICQELVLNALDIHHQYKYVFMLYEQHKKKIDRAPQYDVLHTQCCAPTRIFVFSLIDFFSLSLSLFTHTLKENEEFIARALGVLQYSRIDVCINDTSLSCSVRLK